MRKSDLRRAKIFDAALVEFASKTMHGSTMNSIAQIAGVPKSVVHYYFSSKLELYKSVSNFVYSVIADLNYDLKNIDDVLDQIKNNYDLTKIERHCCIFHCYEIIGSVAGTSA